MRSMRRACDMPFESSRLINSRVLLALAPVNTHTHTHTHTYTHTHTHTHRRTYVQYMAVVLASRRVERFWARLGFDAPPRVSGTNMARLVCDAGVRNGAGGVAVWQVHLPTLEAASSQQQKRPPGARRAKAPAAAGAAAAAGCAAAAAAARHGAGSKDSPLERLVSSCLAFWKDRTCVCVCVCMCVCPYVCLITAVATNPSCVPVNVVAARCTGGGSG